MSFSGSILKDQPLGLLTTIKIILAIQRAAN